MATSMRRHQRIRRDTLKECMAFTLFVLDGQAAADWPWFVTTAFPEDYRIRARNLLEAG
jgi:hypothetical protein